MLSDATEPYCLSNAGENILIKLHLLSITSETHILILILSIAEDNLFLLKPYSDTSSPMMVSVTITPRIP